MEAIMFVGLPACGKSTYYHNNLKNTHIRISNDLLKTKSRERKLFEYCFDTKMPLCIDNTCITKEVRAKYLHMLKEAGYIVKCYFFKPNVNRSVRWNDKREGLEHLPKVAIYSKVKSLEAPDIVEGFDELHVIDYKEGKVISVRIN